MHTNHDNILIKDILFSFGSYYRLLVRVLVWFSEAVTEICCKKVVLITMKKIFKKYLLKNFIFSNVTDCRHATWLKINFFTGIFYYVTGVTGEPQLASLQFFDLQFFRISYCQLQLFYWSSFKNYENALCYSILKSFLKRLVSQKMFLQGEKRNQMFSPLPFHTLKNVLRY